MLGGHDKLLPLGRANAIAIRRARTHVLRLATHWDLVVATVLIAAIVLLRALAVWPARHARDKWIGDSMEYLRISRLPVGADFFTEHKPWGYPAFLKLVSAGGMLDLLTLVQFAVSGAAWITLAIVVARRFSSRQVGAAAAVAVVALSATWPVAQWDTLPMSESLTMALFALLIASLLTFVSRPGWRAAGGAIATAFCFSQIRDANAAIVAMLLLPAAFAAYRRNPRAAVVVAAAALIVVGVTAGTASVRRWQILTADQIGKRAMLDPEMRSYFVQAGMPVRSHLSALIFEDTRSPLPARTFVEDPRLAFFMPWFLAHGRSVYNRYLISHPRFALVEPSRHIPTIIDTAGLTTYRGAGYRPTLPPQLDAALYPRDGLTITIWSLLALAAAVTAAAARALTRAAVIPVSLAASAFPAAIIIWDGEPSEIPRHVLVASLGARLGLILLLAVACDHYLSRTRRNTCRGVPRSSGKSVAAGLTWSRASKRAQTMRTSS
jgi:hypothetical protein